MREAGLDDVFIDDITFPAVDGYALGATLFLPRGAKQHAVLINSATAVPRKIYRKFAGYLAGRGFAVLTYDYRGIGDSRQRAVTGYIKPKSLVGFKASMADWAALDVTAAVNWMRERYHTLPLTYVGHSFGGQALGLLANNNEVKRALLVAAQAAYWKLITSPERYRIYALLNFVGMPLTRTLGYMPGWAGFGQDLPKGVFEQWARWVMNERYLLGDPDLKALPNYAKYNGALRSICLSDDPWAPRPAIELLCSGSRRRRRKFSPSRLLMQAPRPSAISVSSGPNTATHSGAVRPSGWRRRGSATARSYSDVKQLFPVIASVAKRSSLTFTDSGLLRRSAPRNDGPS